MSLLSKVFLALSWFFIACSLGVLAYVNFPSKPPLPPQIAVAPPDVPCRQGMTLLPGQSCVFQMEIPVARRPARDDL